MDSFSANQGTQTPILVDTTGGVGGTVIAVQKLDISPAGTAGSIWDGKMQGGTINLGTVTVTNPTGTTVTVDHGTITLSNPSGTTVQFNNGTVDLLKAGTITRLEGGTLGRVSTIGTLEVGTITTMPNIPGGTIGVVSNITNGSIRMTVGTVTEGTLRNLISGTINSATAVLNSGTINVGTFVMPSGTLNVATISTLPNLPQGSINVTAGTVGGKAASGAIASGNPVLTGGTDSGGTVYGFLTDVNGVLQINGTVATGGAGTQPVRLIDGTLTLISAVVPGVGATNLGKAEDAAHASGDTGVAFWGVRNDAGTAFGGDGDYVPFSIDSGGNARVNVIAIPNVNMATGTLNVGTVVNNGGTVAEVTNLVGGTLTRLAQGSINVTAGTVNAGTINTGTINAGTINAGTFRADARTTQNIISFGTQVVGTAAIAATIVGSAAVGAGTSLWLQDVSITNNNANVLCVLGFGTAQQGTNVLLRHTLGTTGAVGIEKPFAKAVNAGMTNQDLVFSLGAAGTVDLTISYFISA